MLRNAYRAFGLRVESTLPLPELHGDEAAGAADVVIDREPGLWEAHRPTTRWYEEGTKESSYFWPNVVVRLEEGRRVFYDAAEGEDMSLVRSCLLGPVAAGMMRQRGYLPLHASAVAPGPKAPVVAMLGWCGWGKSSTAAALYARGWSWVADDLLALDHAGKGPVTCVPAFPRVRLAPAMADRLGITPPSTSPRNGGGEPESDAPLFGKVSFEVARAFSPKSRGINALMVLEESEATSAHRMSQSEAFRELLRHTFTTRWICEGARERHLVGCAQVAERVPIYRLSVCRSDSMDTLIEVLCDALQVPTARS